MKDYDTAYISAEWENAHRKAERSKRRKDERKKHNKRMQEATNNVLGYYLRTSRPKYIVADKLIPATVTCEFKITEDGDLVPIFLVHPAHIVKVHKYVGEEMCDPYLKRCDVSENRKFAKRQTNKAVRHAKIDCNVETYLDTEFEDMLSEEAYDAAYCDKPGAYRKAFNYKWAVY